MDTYTEALHPRLHGRWIEKGGEAPSVGKGDSKTPTKGGIPKGMTVESAKAFLDGHYKKWRTGLSPAHEKAMRFYQSPGFALMNGQLRGLDTAGLKTRERASDSDLARAKIASKNLVAAIKTAPPLTGPLTVYRGYDAARYPSQVGATVTEPAFTSTSLTPNVATVGKATEQAVAEITLPAGTRAAAGSSRELVLPPGAKFKVTKVTTKRGVRHV
ncbi:MAG: ADP-ribosyltransferase, partial [Acidimicrobiales bacterium]